MKTCARCGRTYPLDQTFCSACGLALPGLRGLAGAASGAASADPDGPAEPRAAQIDFLLAQLDEWVRSGWVAPEQARRLWDIYQLRRQQLFPALNLPLVPEVSPVPASAPVPESVPTVPAPPRRKFPLAAFLESRNLSLWQLLGALLLLAGLAGLIGWTWGTVGRYLVLALMLGLTGGLPTLARSRFVRSEPLTRSSFLAVAALLVPLDIVAVNAFRLLGGALGTAEIGLAASVVSLPLYGWLARREPGRWPASLLAAAVGFVLYFALRVLLPGGLRPEARSLVYSTVFAGLTLGFFLAARRAEAARREVWRGAAQVASLSALALALWLGGPGTVGPAAVPLLLLGVVYAAAAVLLNDKSFVFVAQAALTVGGLLALPRFLPGGGTLWFVSILWGQAVGLASAGLSRGRGTDASLARAWADGGLALAVLALTAQAARLAWDWAVLPAWTLPPSEIGGFLAAALLSFGYFAWARRGTLAASLGVYLVVLIYWLAARLLWHGPVNFALPLAGAAGALWMLKRPARFAEVSLAAASLGLLVCFADIVLGLPALWLTTALALPLVVWAFALREQSGESASIWPLLGAATLEALLLESRLLPWTAAHWGWEANYGFGLVPLSLLALVFSERRSRVWLWAGLLMTAGNVLLQLVYAGFGRLDYSPLTLLALGALLAFGIAFARPASRAADCGTALLAAFYAAFLLGLLAGHAGSPAGRETAAAIVLLLFCPLTAWLAFWVRRPSLIYCAALSGALGLLHGLHRWHPAAAFYAAAIWPYAAVLFGAALWAERQRRARWSAALGNSAAIISVCVLLGAASATLLGFSAGSAASATLLAVLCSYGALYAGVGVARQSQPLASFAALTLSGAFWLALVQASPHLSGPRLGFALSLGGFIWLAAALGAERVASARFAGRVLNFAAIGIGLAGILVALTGLNGTDNRFAVYVLLVAGSVFLGAARGLSLPGWGQVGVAAYFLAYFAFLEKRLGAPGAASSDFYLIPAGLYVLALGLLSRRRAGPNTPAYFLCGLLLVLTPTLAAAWPVSAPPLHAVLLLFEGVGAVFYGIAARIKLFAGTGAAFLLVLLLRELQGFAGHIHWAVYATGLGLLILASALYFEKRGDAVRGWAQATREKLSDWD